MWENVSFAALLLNSVCWVLPMSYRLKEICVWGGPPVYLSVYLRRLPSSFVSPSKSCGGGRHGHVPLRNHVIHGGLGKHRLRLELLPVLPRPDVQSEFVALVGVLGAKAHVALVAGLQLQVLLAGGVGARGVLDGLEVAGRLPFERGSRRELFPFERGIDHGLLDVRVPDPCVVFAVFAIVALTCVHACLLPQ